MTALNELKESLIESKQMAEDYSQQLAAGLQLAIEELESFYELEKQQIKEAHMAGQNSNHPYTSKEEAEEYYENTFNFVVNN